MASDSMKNENPDRSTLSLAELVGFVSCLVAALFLFYDVRLTIIPLSFFLMLCIVAPFLPRFSFFLPIISRGKSEKKAVAITFDDGPDSLTTPELLRLLSKHDIKATFFVAGKKAAEYPELIKEIVSQGHSVGNHSYSHDRFIMLKSIAALLKEVESTQDVLKGFGVTPLAFRPPGGITTPRLRKVLQKLGMYNVNFSCRVIDGGNRWVNGLSEKLLKRIRSDDIVALHDIRPQKEALFSYWLNEIELIFSGIKSKGFSVLPLSALIEKPVMIRSSEPER